jgi:hypothetical protein
VKLSNLQKSNFCNATNGAWNSLSHIYCGRKTKASYLSHYERNVWKYEHQRCKAWELPDAGDLGTPALDWLLVNFMSL